MTTQTSTQNSPLRLFIITGLIVAAFFGAYKFASARSGQAASAAAVGATQGAAQAAPQASVPGNGAAPVGSGSCCGGGAGSAGGSCCGGGSGQPTTNGVTGAPVTGTAQVAAGVQAIGVKVGTTYAPNIIKLKAGIPAEITFGQGGGCTAQVVSQALGFSVDVSGGPQIVKLPALSKGTYGFSCGMGMVFGKIVVE